MIVLRLFSRLFLTFTKTVRADCFLGVKFRVPKQGVFSEYDIVFGGKRERVSQIEVAFFEFVFWKDNVWIYLSLVGV